MSWIIRPANPGEINRFYGYERGQFVACFWWVGWDCFSFGFHVCAAPNVEIHLPFGFIRIGMRR